MAQQIIQNLESGAVVRQKINDNFQEVYAAIDAGVVTDAQAAAAAALASQQAAAISESNAATSESNAAASAAVSEQARDVAVGAATDFDTEAEAVAGLADGAFGSYKDTNGLPVYGQRVGSAMVPIPGEWFLDIRVGGAANRSALKALPAFAGAKTYLLEPGREGWFVFRPGDYSAQVTADTQEGIYIKANDNPANVGAWVRSYDGLVNVKWFGAAFDGVTVDTTALRAAIATGVDLEWPTGVTVIDGTLDGRTSGAWYGAGMGTRNAFNSTFNGDGTFIRCVGDNSGDPFIRPPQLWDGFHLDGVDKTGRCLEQGEPATFANSVAQWSNIRIRRFADVGDVYNIFWWSLCEFHCQGNVRGLRHAPENLVGDNGYSTTVSWVNVTFEQHDEWGLDLSPDLVSGTWTWKNVTIQRNAIVGGSWQCRLKNMRIAFDGIYLESNTAKPAMRLQSANLFGSEGFFNGTGGVDFGNQPSTLIWNGVRMTSTTDVVANVPSTASIHLTRCRLATDLRTNTALKRYEHCEFNSGSGLVVSNHTRFQRLVLGNRAAATELRDIAADSRTYSGTIGAGAEVTVQTNRALAGAFEANAIPMASVRTTEGVEVRILPATTGNPGFYTIKLRNITGSDITLTGVVIDVAFLRFVLPS
jgi:hypothetical protein